MARKVAAIFLSVVLLPLCAAAQTRSISVHVPGRAKPQQAVGLLITSAGTLQKPATRVEQDGADTLVVEFNYDADELEGDSFASAMVTDEDGRNLFADLKLIADSASSKSFYDLPDCPPKEITKMLGQDQSGLLESLIQIRAARREAHQLRVTSLMKSGLADKLNRLEKGFGFKYGTPVSANLSAFELLDRLSRLVNAVKNYQDPKSGN